MILRHWHLRRDPFVDGDSTYAATPVHDEAVARIVHAVEAGERRVTLVAGPGLGKSMVLGEALGRLRQPRRRIARVVGPGDGPSLLAELAQSLGVAANRIADRAGAWRALADAVKLCRYQGLSVVLAVDDGHRLVEAADRDDLERLAALDCHPAARVAVIRLGRPPEDDAPGMEPEPWDLAIRLVPLSRSEAREYIGRKLAEAGRVEPTFTPRAVTRLHALAGGVPRGLDRLASLALTAGAVRGLEIIGPEVVEGVATECHAWAVAS